VWRAKRECQRNGVTVKAQVELALRCAFQSLDGGGEVAAEVAGTGGTVNTH
jgi:hypothetical protein